MEPEVKLENVEQKDEKSEEMDKNTMLAVLQFLKKHNLKETETLFKKEAKISEDEIKSEDSSSRTESEVTQALAAYKSGGDPDIYTDQYSSLKNFIEKSLDIHKCELSTVLYPTFVHMYLELVYNNHEARAKAFFEAFHEDQEDYYFEDLKQLQAVQKPEHMRGNQLLETFRTSKFVIHMSRDTYNHLKRHLQEQKQNKLLNIVQEHLFIEVFDGAPRTKFQIDATSGGMSGEAKREANKGKVLYGLLKEPDLNIPLDDEDEQQEEDKPKKKKAKKDPSLIKKSKNDPNAPQLIRIPLPELKDSDKLEKIRMYKESMKRVGITPEQLPSVCFYTFMNAYQGVTASDVCEDSSLMSAGFADSGVRVWSMTKSKLRSMKPTDDLNSIDKETDDVLERMMDDRTASDYKFLLGHSGPVYSTSFSQDRTSLVSASEDGTIRLWSLLTWSNMVCYKGHNYPVWDVKFGPSGHYFASAGCDRTARLWTTDHHQPVRIFAGHLADVDTLQFHPNCNYIATGSTDRTVRLWDVMSGKCVRHMTGHKGPVYSLAFSPDGRYLASAGLDKNVLLWDISSGDLVSQLKGHTNTVYSLAFSREGSVLATGGIDNTIRLWDINKLFEDLDGETVSSTISEATNSYQLACFPTKNSPVLCLHFTRRNLLLCSGPFVS